LVDLFIAELQLFDEHAKKVAEGEVDALLLLNFVKTLLVHFGNVHKKQVIFIVNFKV
jgi:hypothetical protein